MKIVIATGLYPPEIGGPATYAKLFEERLPKYGIEVSILPFSTVRHLPQIIRHIAYFWKTVRLSRNVDAILVQDTVSTGFPAAVASLLVRKPLILRVPGDYAWEQGIQRFGVRESLDDFQKRSYGLRVAILRAIQRFVARRARRVIAPSRYLARIVSGWISNKKDIDVIYNGVALAQVGFAQGVRAHGREVNRIVSSGRLVPWKGFGELIGIVAKHRDWRLDIFGDGPGRRELEERIATLGAGGRIALKGSVSREDMLETFARAAVFVLNSRYEGLSHTLVEAMAAGAPVVATRVGGNPEVVEDGANGLLVEAGDAAGLERALARLLSDEALRWKLGDAARDLAKDFSIEKTVEATANLIKSAV